MGSLEKKWPQHFDWPRHGSGIKFRQTQSRLATSITNFCTLWHGRNLQSSVATFGHVFRAFFRVASSRIPFRGRIPLISSQTLVRLGRRDGRIHFDRYLATRDQCFDSNRWRRRVVVVVPNEQDVQIVKKLKKMAMIFVNYPISASISGLLHWGFWAIMGWIINGSELLRLVMLGWNRFAEVSLADRHDRVLRRSNSL